MGSFEWMELQTLTSEVATARSRLAAARSGGNPRHLRGLEEEVAAAEARRARLISHITTNLVDTQKTAPGPAATAGANVPQDLAAVAENGAQLLAAAPRSGRVAGGLVAWDRLTPGDIARATNELGARRARVLARHAAELSGLDTDQAQVESLERAIAAFMRKIARLPPTRHNTGDIATPADDRGLRLQARG